MQHRETKGLLLDYCAHKLDAAVAVKLERHVQNCPDCAEFVVGQWEVWSALEVWRNEPIPEGFDQRLYARVHAEEQRSWTARLRDSWVFRQAAPLAAACGVAVLAFMLNMTPDQPRAATPVSASTIELVDAEALERTLDDMDMLKQLGPAEQPLTL